MVIRTVDVQRFQTEAGATWGLADVCADDQSVHLRLNCSGDEVVMVLDQSQILRLIEMLAKGLIAVRHGTILTDAPGKLERMLNEEARG